MSNLSGIRCQAVQAAQKHFYNTLSILLTQLGQARLLRLSHLDRGWRLHAWRLQRGGYPLRPLPLGALYQLF